MISPKCNRLRVLLMLTNGEYFKFILLMKNMFRLNELSNFFGSTVCYYFNFFFSFLNFKQKKPDKINILTI